MQCIPTNCKMIVIFCILDLFVGIVYAQTDPSASDVLKALPVDLQGKVNETIIQDVMNKSTENFKAKCEKNGGDAAIVKLQIITSKKETE